MIGRNQITAIINTCWDAVNASKAGPIQIQNDAGETILNSVGYNVFLNTVAKLIPTDFNMKGEIAGMDAKSPSEHSDVGAQVQET